jgi:hypothetical protein
MSIAPTLIWQSAAFAMEDLSKESGCPPHTSPNKKGWYEINRVYFFTQVWSDAHLQSPSTNPCLTDLDFGFAKPIMVDGTETGTFEMNFRPSDNPPTDCQGNKTKKLPCWYEGYFHYVSTNEDPNYGKMMAALMSIDFTKSRMFIYLDPQHIDHDWYRLKVESKSKQSSKDTISAN